MNFEVFEYLCALEQYGSLNQAAKHLYVSQPNLSNVLTSFEKEIGFAVIERSHRGIRFTPQGRQVLQSAHRILQEKQNLLSANSRHSALQLRISAGREAFTAEAAAEVMRKYEASHSVMITLESHPVQQALEKTAGGEADAACIIIPEEKLHGAEEFCHASGLQMTICRSCACEINIRRQHPLLEHFSFDGLWNYPFADYTDQQEGAYGRMQQYLNPKKRIMTDSWFARCQIVSRTDAFSIGSPLPERIREMMQLTSIPVPDLVMHICEVHRCGTGKDAQLICFLDAVKKALFAG